MTTSIAGLLLISAVAALEAQPNYNLDFETVTRGRLRGWAVGPGYELTADENAPAQGRYAMRIASTTAAANALGSTGILLPPDLFRGRRAKISGFVRTEAVAAPGYAAIWFRVDSPTGAVLALRNMSEFSVNGTTDWRRYEYELDVTPAAGRIIIGTFLAGQGRAWFDDIRVEIDGSPLPQGPAPEIGEPKPELLSWIRDNAIAFRTENAGTATDDLQPLKRLIGNARVVGLGEATHGSAEFFRMKHRLVEFLATEMGFTIFSIEANMPEAFALNDYVMRGQGDPKRLLQGMYFWTWNTQEVLDMIEWMRRFNQSGRGRIQFTGFDMQTSTVAARIVREFVAKADPSYLGTVDEAYRQVATAATLPLTNANINQILAAAQAANRIRRTLEDRTPGYRQAFPLAEVDWAVQNARVTEQAAFYPIGGSLHRDDMMALNTDWILEQNPGARMAIWAHNYHVSRQTGAQGSYLARWYGNDYVVLGFAFNSGRYSALALNANGSLGPLNSNNVAVEGYPGSVEYVLHQTGLPRFILDLRAARANNPGAWFLGANEFREVGAAAIDGYAVRPALTTELDALIWIDQTTPSTLLPFER